MPSLVPLFPIILNFFPAHPAHLLFKNLNIFSSKKQNCEKHRRSFWCFIHHFVIGTSKLENLVEEMKHFHLMIESFSKL